MSEQKPSVGRIVLVTGDPKYTPKIQSNGVLVHPAIINRVWSDTTVNVTVFPDAGDPFNMTSLTQVEDISDLKGASSGWAWPPRV